MTIDDRFKKAIEIRNSGDLNRSIEEFKAIIKDHPNDNRIGGVYTVLGGVYRDLSLHKNAKDCFLKATMIKPDSELASLGLFLSYGDLGNYKFAIDELKRYLNEYPAARYKITLQELLEDIEDGYATKFKDIIVELAKKHNVSLPD